MSKYNNFDKINYTILYIYLQIHCVNSVKFQKKYEERKNNDFEKKKHTYFKGSKDKLLRLIGYGIYGINFAESTHTGEQLFHIISMQKSGRYLWELKKKKK